MAIRYIEDATDLGNRVPEGFFEGWPNPPSPDTHARLLRKSSAVVVAIDDKTDRMIGFVTAISDGVLTAYVPLLEVLPEYRQQGVGLGLMGRILEKLSNLYAVDLLCEEDLQPFYEKSGMRKTTGMMIRRYQFQSGDNGQKQVKGPGA